jgi:hypothetical protein
VPIASGCQHGPVNARRGLITGSTLIVAALLVACAAARSDPGGQTTHAAKTAVAVAHSAGRIVPPAGSVAGAGTPCTKSVAPPVATRLTHPKDYPEIQTHLAAVESTTQPKVSALEAFARMTDYQGDPASCGITETLAYWSSDTPATIPADCAPPANIATPWAAPSNCPSTPLYPRVFAWVFYWHTDCTSLGGPAPLAGTSPRPMPSWPPHACSAITFVDADTSHRSDYLTTGGF